MVRSVLIFHKASVLSDLGRHSRVTVNDSLHDCLGVSSRELMIGSHLDQLGQLLMPEVLLDHFPELFVLSMAHSVPMIDA